MRYFITNRIHNVKPDKTLQIKSTIFLKTMLKNLSKMNKVAFDVEDTELDAYKSKILLLTFSCSKHTYTIDRQSVDIPDLIYLFSNLNAIQFVGHNIKYDIKKVFMDCGYRMKNIWDTMIVDQRLYMGIKMGNAIDDLCLRYFGKLPHGMEENISTDWIGKDPTIFKFSNKHIHYACADTEILLPLVELQIKYIEKYKMEFLLYNIEFPLVYEIAMCELEGAYLDKKKLLELVEFNLKEKLRLENTLDEELRELREDPITIGLTDDEKMFLKAGKYDRPRGETTSITQLDLFDSDKDAINEVETSKGNINWNSTIQLVTILGRLNQPVPTNVYQYVIPRFRNDGRLLKTAYKFTTGEKELNEYLIDNPHSPVKKMLQLLIEYRGIIKELSTYGLNLIQSINPISGKIHTSYRQCGAINGRFQSGGGKKEPDKINSQNIPRKKELRELFSAGEDYNVLTIDLTGAEVTIMAAKAKDTKLFDLAMKGDMHSHMATLCWRAIYKSRGDKLMENTFVISKTINKEMRQDFKNETFAVIYNVGDRKAGKIIGVSKEEGRIVKATIKKEIPLTFNMVERNAALALKYGYLVLNERTKSRKWFPPVMDALKIGKVDEDGFADLDFKIQNEVEGEARNIPISGTQADMIKEMIVEIGVMRDTYIWDIGLIFQVHDELVYRIPKREVGNKIAEKIKSKMCEVANRYLGNLIQMGASATIAETWTKD